MRRILSKCGPFGSYHRVGELECAHAPEEDNAVLAVLFFDDVHGHRERGRVAVDFYLSDSPVGVGVTGVPVDSIAAGLYGTVIPTVPGVAGTLVTNGGGLASLLLTYTGGAGTWYIVVCASDGTLVISEPVVFV